MNKVSKPVFDVLTIIHETAQLNPKDEPFFLSPKKTSAYDDLEAILKKLEKDDKVLKIVQYPNQEKVPNNEFGMLESELGSKTLDKLLSFVIQLNPSFEDFYQEQYALSQLGVEKLNHDNFFRVFDIMEEIGRILNASTNNKVTLEASKYGNHFWRGLSKEDFDANEDGEEGISLTKIAELQNKALDFLKSIEVANNIEVAKHDSRELEGFTVDQIDYFVIDVNRKKFIEVLEEMKKLNETKFSVGTLSEKQTKDNRKNDTLEFLHLDTSKPMPILRYMGKKIDMDSSTVEYYVIKEVLDCYPKPAEDENIFLSWAGKENKQTLYDATNRLNKKLCKLLGVEGKPLVHKNAKYWISDEYEKHLKTSDKN